MGELRAKLGAAGAFLLLVVVAVAAGVSGGSTASGGPAASSAGGLGVPDWAGSIVVGLVAGGGTVLVYGLVAGLFRGRRGRRRFVMSRWPWWYWPVMVAAAAVVVGLMALVLKLVAHAKLRAVSPVQLGRALPTGRQFPLAGTASSHANVSWEPLVVGVGVALAAVLAYVLLSRRRAGRASFNKPLGEREELQQRQREALGAIDESLDALWAEPDPRKAVIAAYARMESWLARAGFARRASEAPFEYLERVVASLGATTAVGARLTNLFERAKFDRRPCGEDMRRSALDALGQLRDQLGAAALLPALSS